MVLEAEGLGLRVKQFKRDLFSSEKIEFQESLKRFWHLFELLPFRRLTFSRTRRETLDGSSDANSDAARSDASSETFM